MKYRIKRNKSLFLVTESFLSKYFMINLRKEAETIALFMLVMKNDAAIL